MKRLAVSMTAIAMSVGAANTMAATYRSETYSLVSDLLNTMVAVRFPDVAMREPIDGVELDGTQIALLDAKEMAKPKKPGCFQISEISVKDSKILNTQLVASLTNELVGECATKDVLGKALNSLNGYLVDSGYVTSRVYIGPQDLADGTIEFTAVDGRIERIQYQDNDWAARTQVAAAFPVGEGDILRLIDLERGIDQISAPRSQQVTMNLIPGTKPGYSIVDLVDRPKDQLARSVRFRAGIDNFVTKSEGSEKSTIGIDADNILNLNDSWSLTHIGSFDTNALAVSGSFPMGYWTHGIAYSYSDYLAPIDSNTQLFGRSETKTVNTKFRFYKSKTGSVDFTASIDKKFSDRVINDVELADQKMTVGRLGTNFSYMSDYSLSGSASWSHGLEWFDATKDTDLSGASPRAQFDKFQFNANLYKPINQYVSLSSSLSGQYARDPLYSSEQISIGGQYSVRGFSRSPSSGDSGAYIRNDLMFRLSENLGPKWMAEYLPYVQPYLGFDYGWVDDNALGNQNGLGGFGYGVRFNYGKLSADIGAGIPLYKQTGTYVKKPDKYTRITYDLYTY